MFISQQANTVYEKAVRVMKTLATRSVYRRYLQEAFGLFAVREGCLELDIRCILGRCRDMQAIDL